MKISINCEWLVKEDVDKMLINYKSIISAIEKKNSLQSKSKSSSIPAEVVLKPNNKMSEDMSVLIMQSNKLLYQKSKRLKKVNKE